LLQEDSSNVVADIQDVLGQFEKKNGYSIDKDWLNKVALKTQVVIKKESLNCFHGRVLYSELSKYINNYDSQRKEKIIIFETGTARGFSALCMSKALIDQEAQGLVVTLDCISHNEKIFWNCITDIEGPCSRSELLSSWPNELKNILFIQGWTNKTLKKIGLGRINFAFLDAQHTKKDVLAEFDYVSSRQLKGDIVIFDDVTPGIFNGVCEAVDEIKEKYNYSIRHICFSDERGYAIAYKL